MIKETVSKETSKAIAEEILKQLGVGKLKAMINARNFMVVDYGVQFTFSGSRTWNTLKIQLNYKDLYDVTFLKMPNMAKVKSIADIDKKLEQLKNPKTKIINDIYCDILRETIEQETGLYLTL